MSSENTSPLAHASQSHRIELFSFTGPFLYTEIAFGKVGLEATVGMIAPSIEEARSAMEEGHIAGFTEWWERNLEDSTRVHRALYSSANSYTLVDPEGEMLYLTGFKPNAEDFDLPPSPERWRSTVRRYAAQYVAAYFIDPANPLPPQHRKFQGGPEIQLLKGVPSRLPAHELAAQIAQRLTAEESPGRLSYRLKTRRGKGPHYPAELLRAVGEEMNVSTATARRKLIEGGFELPTDLGFVLRSPGSPKGSR